MESTMVDAMYRDRGIDFQTSSASLGELVEQAAELPLLAQPGAEWTYSIATDVLGHLVAVISGQPFEEFLCDRSSSCSG
jgi:CubicO group peptidase (beta-lactamase class C family)